MSAIETKFLKTRMRRLREHSVLRDLVREHRLSVDDLVVPLFVKEGITENQAINTMPGCYQCSLSNLHHEIAELVSLGISAVILFGIPLEKDPIGKSAFADHGIVQQAIRHIKQQAPELLVIVDVCCCEYTDHAHCGVLKQLPNNVISVDNDVTLALLAKQAVSFARAGADVVAPSGMMDGMVHAIRMALDQENFTQLPILSYSTKFASSFYGPFRDAAESVITGSDRRTYQMDPANANQALREAELDIHEGADMLMVKPATHYLDIIYRTKQRFPHVPLAAYQVSGEFAMIKAAAQQGWLDETQAMLESVLAIKRAGADFMITYFAKDIARYLHDHQN